MRKPVCGRGFDGRDQRTTAGAEAGHFLPDAAEEKADEPNDDSLLPTSYCKDGPAVEIGGCRAIVVDASVDTTAWVALQLVYRSDPV